MFDVKIIFDGGENGAFFHNIKSIKNTDIALYLCDQVDCLPYTIPIDEHLSGVVLYFNNEEDKNERIN